jgi:hypothetical protein
MELRSPLRCCAIGVALAVHQEELTNGYEFAAAAASPGKVLFMRKVLSICLLVASLCAVAAGYSSSSAVAAVPHGALSKIEYKQLHEWLSDETIFDKKGDLKEGAAGCNALISSTPLIQMLQSSCVADLRVYTEFLTIRAAQQECAQAAANTNTTATSTTTTGTTTTPTIGGLTIAQLQEYVCLKPLYEYVSRNLASMYAADSAAHRTAAARGLSGSCLNTIVATSEQLRDEQNMEAAENRAIADVAVLAKFQNNYTSSSAVSGDRVKADLSAYDRAFRKFDADSTPDKLSTCPHQ